MFMGPLEAVKPWQTEQLSGITRFQNRVYLAVSAASKGRTQEIGDETLRLLHKTMKMVTENYETMSFNNAVSNMMILTTHLLSLKDKVPVEAAEKLALMLSPLAPHLGEECWSMLGHTESLAYHPWVEFDEALCVDDKITMGVQINGKRRTEITLAKDADE